MIETHSPQWFTVTARLLIGATLLACSGPATDDTAELSFASESGALRVTVTSEPASRPVRGTNRIVYLVEWAETLAPADHLELTMTPFMPAHGHGSTTEPSVEPQGQGRYQFDEVILTMPGLWELRTTVTGALSDYLVPRFEVE